MYCTSDDIIARRLTNEKLVELTNDTPDGAVIDQVKVDTAIADAQAEIDSYLRGRISLPLEGPVPAILRRIAVNIAVRNLYLRRLDLSRPDYIDKDYKEDLAKLEAIQRGEITITADDVGRVAGAIRSNKRRGDRMFDKHRLGEF